MPDTVPGAVETVINGIGKRLLVSSAKHASQGP